MRALVAVLAGTVVAALGVVLLLGQGGASSSPGRAVATVDVGRLPASRPASHPRTSGPSSSRPSTRSRVPAASAGIVPARLRIARLGVDAAVRTTRLDGAVMQVPLDPRLVGWWRGGARPGAADGTAVLVGHVNYAGVAGALSVLPQLRPGDRIVVSGARTVRYRVAAVRTYPKDTGLPQDLFVPGGAAQLVLITCGGPFDASSGNYEDNIVAYAVPTRS